MSTTNGSTPVANGNGTAATAKANGLPADFIYPNQPSKCVWKQLQTKNPHVDRSYTQPPRILPNILHAIGDTPLVRLNKIPQSEGIECDMYVKCEFFNPGGSVKDRIGYRMVEDAEAAGRLTPGCTIIEPTSGNTGIGLAIACAVKGYKCVIVMPEKMSTEKSDTLKALGATIIRTPTEAGYESPEGLICVAQRLCKETPNSVVLDQYRNPGNPLAHYDGTGEEILRQCGGRVDMIVCGAGTGGTISGIGRKMKDKCPDCIVVAADPEGSILSLPEELNETSVEFYDVEGIGYDFIPTVLDRSVVDRWYKSNDQLAFPLARRLIREEGILSGGSSGTAMSVALQAARELKKGQCCVVLLPDGIRNYMTKFVSDNWMEARLLKPVVNEHGHWWWSNTVAELTALPAPLVVSATTTCDEALRQLRAARQESANVLDTATGALLGVVSLDFMMRKARNMNLSLQVPVSAALFKTFRRVPSDASLGLVSRILDKDAFVVVEGTWLHVRNEDLYDFVAAGEKKAASQTNGHH